MTRDFKNRAQPKDAPPKKRSCAFWFIAGLMAGAFAVGFAWLQLDPGLIRSGDGLKDTGVPRPQVDPNKRPPASAAFEFEFPDLLRTMEVTVPGEEPEPEPAPAPPPVFEKKPPPAQAESKEREAFELQIASFRKPEDAEKLKAQLALIGVVTRIQKVTIDDGKTYHRVRSGPYRNRAELDKISALLKRNDIDPIVVKWRG